MGGLGISGGRMATLPGRGGALVEGSPDSNGTPQSGRPDRPVSLSASPSPATASHFYSTASYLNPPGPCFRGKGEGL